MNRRYVLCPFNDAGEYDTDIQFDELNDIVKYSIICDAERYALLDAFSLEWYGDIYIDV